MHADAAHPDPGCNDGLAGEGPCAEIDRGEPRHTDGAHRLKDGCEVPAGEAHGAERRLRNHEHSATNEAGDDETEQNRAGDREPLAQLTQRGGCGGLRGSLRDERDVAAVRRGRDSGDGFDPATRGFSGLGHVSSCAISLEKLPKADRLLSVSGNETRAGCWIRAEAP